MNRTGTCAYLLQSSFCVLIYSHEFLSLHRLHRTRLSVLAQDYWNFPTIFICVFFQDAACKRPWGTEDHLSHCSFVCWKDSTWVGVSINNQIQGESVGGGHARSLGGGLCHPDLETLTLFQSKMIHFATSRQETLFHDPASFCFAHRIREFSIVKLQEDIENHTLLSGIYPSGQIRECPSFPVNQIGYLALVSFLTM